MAPKVFLTGTTGYIGGDSFFSIAQAHPDWQLSVLVRNKERGAKLAQEYPQARVVEGDLNSIDILEEETKNADIVYHFADCDHEASAQAIAKGAAHHTPKNPVWIIHTSGTGILTVEDFRANTWGIERPGVYNDWDGVKTLLSLPDDSLHRNVDKIIIGAGQHSPDSVKTAIVCPPAIYGPGRGPGNQKSVQAYWLSATVLKRKKGLLVGKGTNVWNQVHVQDLSKVYQALGEAAAAGGGQATWNDEGYYFAENGSFVWGDIQRAVAQAAFDKKLIPSPDVEPLSDQQVTELNNLGLYIWGSNSRSHALRARKLLGWNPDKPSLLDLVPDIVELEAKDLGLL